MRLHAERIDGTTQMLHRKAHAALYRSERCVEDFGDLRLRQAAEVGEFDDGALIGRERIERSADVAFQLVLHCNLRGPGTLGRPIAFRIEFEARAYATLTIDRSIAHDREQPRADRVTDAGNTRCARPKREERLLGEIVRNGTIRANARCERRDGRRVSAVEFVKCVRSASDDEA